MAPLPAAPSGAPKATLPSLCYARRPRASTPTTHQQQLLASLQAKARKQSDAATPELLALLDGAAFRRAVAESFPSLASAPARTLLGWVERQVRASELTTSLSEHHLTALLSAEHSSHRHLPSEWDLRLRASARGRGSAAPISVS